MPRRDVTADWSVELDDSFQGRVVDGSLQFVSVGPPVRTVWLAVWSPPSSEPAEANIAWAKKTAAASGVEDSGMQEFEEPGADADELRYARWYHETVDGRPRWALHAYTARRGDLVQAAFLSDSPDDRDWALSSWRSLRTRRAEGPGAAPPVAVPEVAVPEVAVAEVAVPQVATPPDPAGARALPKGEVGLAALVAFAEPAPADIAAAADARVAEYGRLGHLDPAPIPTQLNPSLRPTAAWPTPQQDFRRIGRGPWTVIASSGLSNPYNDPAQTPTSGRHGAAHRVGLGVEVLVEADDPALLGPSEGVAANWALQLAWHAAQIIAQNGLPMVDWLNEYRVGSIEFHDLVMPSTTPDYLARDASGRPVVGALLGLDAPGVPQTIALPDGPVRLLAVTVITARELDYVRQAGAAGRQWLAGALAHAGTAHRSSLMRPSLL